MTAPTLLDRRREQRDRAIAEALVSANEVQALRQAGGSRKALHVHVEQMAAFATNAARQCALVADLEDVADYGAGGGRT